MPAVDLRQGTLDLFILKALSWEPMHGYEVSRWIRTSSGRTLTIEEGALYPALHRLEERGLVESAWGMTDQSRRARYYTLTPAGRAAYRRLVSDWTRYVDVARRILAAGRAAS